MVRNFTRHVDGFAHCCALTGIPAACPRIRQGSSATSARGRWDRVITSISLRTTSSSRRCSPRSNPEDQWADLGLGRWMRGHLVGCKVRRLTACVLHPSLGSPAGRKLTVGLGLGLGLGLEIKTSDQTRGRTRIDRPTVNNNVQPRSRGKHTVIARLLRPPQGSLQRIMMRPKSHQREKTISRSSWSTSQVIELLQAV